MASQSIDPKSFLCLCSVLHEISETSSRLEIQSLLRAYLKKIRDHSAIVPVLGLLSCKYHPVKELQVGESLIHKTFSQFTGVAAGKLKNQLRTKDIADIIRENTIKRLFESKKDLSVVDVFQALHRSCSVDTVKEKIDMYVRLLAKSTPLEARYIYKFLECKLKIGLALETILVSLGQAFYGEEGEVVRTAYYRQADFDLLVANIRAHGPEDLLSFHSVLPGVCMRPMLAQPATSITECLTRMGNDYSCEYKYDGERAQVHGVFRSRPSSTVSQASIIGSTVSDISHIIFSRNGENISAKYGDIVKVLDRSPLHKHEYILDCEVVAIENGIIQTFQKLSTRKRLGGEVAMKAALFVFDCLFLERPLIDSTLSERLRFLEGLSYIPGTVERVVHTFSPSEAVLEDFYAASLESCEGLMVKSLGSRYYPMERSNKWLKLKKDYVYGDSFDLVLMGCFHGEGKRRGVFGAFLVGSLKDNSVESVCRVGTGFSDEVLKRLTRSIRTTPEKPKNYVSGVVPDAWVECSTVWEVKFADITESPAYSCSSVEGRGLSLRFPRFVRERRDKGWDDGTQSSLIREMYLKSIKGPEGGEN